MYKHHHLADLHRHIRLKDWTAVRQTIIDDEHEDTTSCTSDASSKANLLLNEMPLTLVPNSIGWTSAHFTALHGTPSLNWWKWMLFRILEDYHCFKDSTRSHTTNPFLVRTEAGHTPSDLFFAKYINPLPFQSLQDRHAADQLKESIRIVTNFSNIHIHNCNHNTVLMEIKHRIHCKMEEERIRQRQYGCTSDCVLNKDDKRLNMIRDPGIVNHENHYFNHHGRHYVRPHEELNHEMAIQEHNHIYEQDITDTTDIENEILSSSLPTMSINSDILDKCINIIVDFWHKMELLLMASVHKTIIIDQIDNYQTTTDQINNISNNKTLNINNHKNWMILHALAFTGCPIEISNLVIRLYPEQIQQRDRYGNLPLHIAASSHHTSALSEGDWCTFHNSDASSPQKISSSLSPMLKVLLEAFPKGTYMVDGNNRLPINLALFAGKMWDNGVSQIHQAGPDVLLTGGRDATTNFDSFMLAAINFDRSLHRRDHNSCHPIDSLNLYNKDELLRAHEHSSLIGMNEEIIAKRSATRNIGSMWKFLPDQAKERALQDAKNDVELMKLTTIFELLIISPFSVRIRNDHEKE